MADLAFSQDAQIRQLSTCKCWRRIHNARGRGDHRWSAACSATHLSARPAHTRAPLGQHPAGRQADQAVHQYGHVQGTVPALHRSYHCPMQRRHLPRARHPWALRQFCTSPVPLHLVCKRRMVICNPDTRRHWRSAESCGGPAAWLSAPVRHAQERMVEAASSHGLLDLVLYVQDARPLESLHGIRHIMSQMTQRVCDCELFDSFDQIAQNAFL